MTRLHIIAVAVFATTVVAHCSRQPHDSGKERAPEQAAYVASAWREEQTGLRLDPEGGPPKEVNVSWWTTRVLEQLLEPVSGESLSEGAPVGK